MKAYKNHVFIENTPCWKKAYYLMNNGDIIFCSNYSKPWKESEIKEDVVKEIERRFD